MTRGKSIKISPTILWSWKDAGKYLYEIWNADQRGLWNKRFHLLPQVFKHCASFSWKDWDFVCSLRKLFNWDWSRMRKSGLARCVGTLVPRLSTSKWCPSPAQMGMRHFDKHRRLLDDPWWLSPWWRKLPSRTCETEEIGSSLDLRLILESNRPTPIKDQYAQSVYYMLLSTFDIFGTITSELHNNMWPFSVLQ